MALMLPNSNSKVAMRCQKKMSQAVLSLNLTKKKTKKTKKTEVSQIACAMLYSNHLKTPEWKNSMKFRISRQHPPQDSPRVGTPQEAYHSRHNLSKRNLLWGGGGRGGWVLQSCLD